MSRSIETGDPPAERRTDTVPAGDHEGGDEDGNGTAAIDRSASRTSKAITVALAAVVPVLLEPWNGTLLGVAGAVLVAGGVVAESRRTISLGAVGLLGGVAASTSGGLGVPLPNLLTGTLLAFVAWDTGRYGLRVGEQLGREASTTRIEVAHALSSVTVGVAGLGLGYGTFRLVDGTGSVAALLAALFGLAVVTAVVFGIDWRAASRRSD